MAGSLIPTIDWFVTYPLLEDGLERRNNVMALNTINIESLSPALQDTVVDVFLGGRVGEGETQRHLVKVLVLVVELDELLQTVRNVLPELLGGTRPQLVGHSVFGLGDIEGTLLLGQGNLANTQVGAAHVEGQVGSLFVAIGEAQDPGDIHGLFCSVSIRALSFGNNVILTMLPPSTVKPIDGCLLAMADLGNRLGINKALTLLELLDEVVYNLLEPGAIYCESLLKVLDRPQQVLGELVHGPYAI